jgi:hypothetical protein
LRVSEEGKRAWEKKTFDKNKNESFPELFKKANYLYLSMVFSHSGRSWNRSSVDGGGTLLYVL